jgi:steroid delta-isomerase-like uncharacterized protein
MIEQMKHMVVRYTEEMWNEGRSETAEELFAPDYVTDNADTPSRKIGPAGIMEYILLLRAALPDLHGVVHEVVAEDKRIAARFTITGTHTGAPLLGKSATGQRVKYDGFGIFHLENGKFARSYVLFDRLGLLTQLGIIPRPAMPPALGSSVPRSES